MSPITRGLQVCLLLALTLVICEGDKNTDPKELVIENVKTMECDRRTKNGDNIHMHYTGKLTDGTQFDSSVGRNPLSFELGKGMVIRGWDEGLQGMCIGDKRKLIIPSDKAYGARGAGGQIPPHATLHFDVELVKIDGVTEQSREVEGERKDMDGGEGEGDASGEMPEMDQSQYFDQIDKNKDEAITKDELTDFIKSEGAGAEDGVDSGEGNDHTEMIEEIFAQEDKDKNGKITRDEFMQQHDEL